MLQEMLGLEKRGQGRNIQLKNQTKSVLFRMGQGSI